MRQLGTRSSWHPVEFLFVMNWSSMTRLFSLVPFVLTNFFPRRLFVSNSTSFMTRLSTPWGFPMFEVQIKPGAVVLQSKRRSKETVKMFLTLGAVLQGMETWILFLERRNVQMCYKPANWMMDKPCHGVWTHSDSPNGCIASFGIRGRRLLCPPSLLLLCIDRSTLIMILGSSSGFQSPNPLESQLQKFKGFIQSSCARFWRGSNSFCVFFFWQVVFLCWCLK